MNSLARLTVVITRAESDGGPLTSRLEERGAAVLIWPTVRHEEPVNSLPLEHALISLENFSWIVFTSPRAVEAVINRNPDLPQGLRVAAVGSSTAGSLQAAGWPVHLVPEVGTAQGLVEAFGTLGSIKGRVLFPGSDIARGTICRGLGELGIRVDKVVAYRTVGVDLDRQECLRQFDQFQPNAITFASPSAVDALYRIFGAETFERLLVQAPAIAIGPVTAQALEALGCPPAAIANPHTLSGLVDAVVDHARPTQEPIKEA